MLADTATRNGRAFVLALTVLRRNQIIASQRRTKKAIS